MLQDKRPYLLNLLIHEAGHEDSSSVDDLKKGFPRSGVFSQKFRPANMTCEDLRRASDLSRTVLGSVQSSGDKELDPSLFEATMKEVDKGFHTRPI